MRQIGQEGVDKVVKGKWGLGKCQGKGSIPFSLDKFSDIIYRYPVIVKTDCQALQDVLMNDKLSVTHVRWWDGVLAHNIINA